MTPQRIALCDGNSGQASLFRTAIQHALIEQGVEVKQISTTGLDLDSLATTLEGFTVVFCFPDTWDLACGSYQMNVADAALRAKVGLLVPFEYGNPMGCFKDDPPVILAAYRVREHCSTIGQAYVSFQTGPAADVVLPGLLRFELDSREHYHAEVTGSGETPISWITSTHVGTYVARLLTTVPNDSLKNRVLSIQGDPKTILDLVTIAAEIAQVSILPTFANKEVMRKAAGSKPSPKTFIIWLLVAWDDGRAHVQGNGDNSLVEGFNVESVRDVITRNIKLQGLNPPPP